MMRRLIAIICILVLLGAYCASFAETIEEASEESSFNDLIPFNEIFEHDSVDLKECSLLPLDYNGFQMALCVDQVNLDTTAVDTMSEDGRTCYINLSESECKDLLSDVIPLSIGPEGAILWYKMDGSLLVQHEKTLVLVLQAINRGEADTDGLLAKSLANKLNSSPDIVEGDVRWSPDGRYIFFNDTSKWFGVQLGIEDPYLIDTFTGEVFLLENDPRGKDITNSRLHYVQCGRFSEDGKAFWYVSRESKPNESEYVIKEYNLITSEIREIYKTSNWVNDFCEMGRNHWLILEQENDAPEGICRFVQLEKMENNEISIQYNMSPIKSASKASVVSVDNDMSLVCLNFKKNVSCFLPYKWGTDVESVQWFFVEDPLKGIVSQKSIDEIDDIFSKSINPGPLQPAEISYISYMSGIQGTSYVICGNEYARTVADTWPGMKEELLGQIIVDCKTMKVKPLWYKGYEMTRLHEETIWTDSFVLGEGRDKKSFYIKPVELQKNLYEIQQPEENLDSGSTYVCSTGTYKVGESQNEDIITVSPVDVDVVNTIISSAISNSEDGTVIKTTLKYKPKNDEDIDLDSQFYPEVITVERYKKFVNKMTGGNKKKVSAYYSLYEPDKLDKKKNAEIMLKCYPNLKNEAMYVLKDGIDAKDIERLMNYFSQAEYSYNDYLEDQKEVNISRFGFNRYSIEYSIQETKGKTYDRTSVLRLAGLCDKLNFNLYEQIFLQKLKNNETQINSTTVLGILQSRSKGKTIQDKVAEIIDDGYRIDNVYYRVSIIDVIETDDTLICSFLVESNR